ncbi:MAG: DUF3015 family protein [Deltaproteobacteria bacterium]|nr:DUF3015 family protein [Deltaproteobacteria bacterium]
MKKLLIMVLCIFFAVLITTAGVYAGQAKDNCGCGLGTVLWGDKADDNVLSQTLQATTNGTSGNQTFGITSGTLECEQPAKIAASEKLMEFVYANMDNLASDIASGKGESLDTLAELMNVPSEDCNGFYVTLQNNFEYIFQTGEESPATILDRIITVSS